MIHLIVRVIRALTEQLQRFFKSVTFTVNDKYFIKHESTTRQKITPLKNTDTEYKMHKLLELCAPFPFVLPVFREVRGSQRSWMTNKMFKCAWCDFCSLFEWPKRTQHYTGSTNGMILGWGLPGGWAMAERGSVLSLKTVFSLFGAISGTEIIHFILKGTGYRPKKIPFVIS